MDSFARPVIGRVPADGALSRLPFAVPAMILMFSFFPTMTRGLP